MSPRPRTRHLLATLALACAGAGVAAPAHADLPPGGGDNTPPKITVTIPPSPWEGWYPGPVDVTISATDAAGIEGLSYTLTGAQTGGDHSDFEPLNLTISQPGTTMITITATDTNGIQATAKYGVGVDLTDPSIEVGGSVTDGGTIRQGQVRTLTYACGDAPTGIASCAATGGLVSGGAVPTDTLGAHRITVSAVDHVGRSRTRSIDYTVEMPLLVINESPVIKGAPASIKVGQTLEATAGLWTPSAERVTYVWTRFGKVVGTGPTYTPTAADVGGRISLQATGHRDGYADTTVPFTTGFVLVERGDFAVGGPTVVTGSAHVGGTLSMTRPTVEPAPSITNLWTIDGEEYETDSPWLDLTAEHAGKTIGCVQIFSRAGYVDATSPCVFPGGATSVVVPGPTAPGAGGGAGGSTDAAWSVLAPTALKGKPVVGKRLRAVLPQLSGPAQTWTYQWLRNGKPIAGATKATYKVRKADRRRKITVRVTSTSPTGTVLVSTATPKRIAR
ncbi:hypothetical protein RB608_19240 [Nocardioides sp. LHD-245]|uniref:hypothetical protein n=1 Tax=Nocardioides sp. LHD-245 TaxID=3051387 RepID=UPI0027DFC064|nr:hypothetical protein [Nocardioides sp. LHD-245]